MDTSTKMMLVVVFSVALGVNVATYLFVAAVARRHARAATGWRKRYKDESKRASALAERLDVYENPVWSSRSLAWRRDFIAEYEFPAAVLDKALARCPSGTDRLLVEDGLRQFFVAATESRGRYAAMVSTTVDEAWHEFITHTKAYAAFCYEAFGEYLHHTPEASMDPDALDRNREVISTTWRSACDFEGVDAALAEQPPALFRSDEAAGIAARPGSHRWVSSCGRKSAIAGRPRTTCKHAPDPLTVCIQHEHAGVWVPAYSTSPLSKPARDRQAERERKAAVRNRPGPVDPGSSATNHRDLGRDGSSRRGSTDTSTDTGAATTAAIVTASAVYTSGSSSSCGSSSCGSSSCGSSSCGSSC